MSLLSPINTRRPSSMKSLIPAKVDVPKLYGVVDFNEMGVEIPASMYYHSIELFIELDSTDFKLPKHTIINLVGIIKLSISEYRLPNMDGPPDDPNFPAVLTITYLPDVFNTNKLSVIHFTAIRAHLEFIKRELDEIIAKIKKGLNISMSFENLHKKLRMRARSFDIEAYMKEQSSIRENKFEMLGESTIISLPEIEQIRLFMPKRFRLLPWHLLFATNKDGVSFSTFYSKAEKKLPLLLLLLGKDGSRVGAFLSQGIQVKSGYTGNGETFVFHFDPYFAGFKWSQNNDFFCSASKKDILIGGGSSSSVDHGSAIYIDDNFMECFSQECETFNSPSLGKHESFEILAVELWHVHT